MADKPTVLVTRKLPDAVEERLSRLFEARLNADDRQMGPDDILAAAQGADGLLICLTERLDGDLIAKLPASVRIVSTYSVGFNHIDLAAARGRGIVVTHTPEAVTDATADATMLLILAAARRAHEFQRMLREGRWRRWSAVGTLGTDIGGKRLGIVGLGRIGRAVARRARAFGMEIHYHSRTPLPEPMAEGAIHHPTLANLFAACPVVSLHCPSTPETRGMIDATSLGWLPPGAILVNTARGDLVVDDDLIAALADGRLAAAGLDVFDGEPEFDKRYLDLPNAYLLPHIGTSTIETRERMGFDATDNLESFFAGREPPFRVV
ncbi:MAG: D-glycerate dehydrogenase [Alphaproteobacteria bacterium]|nr:D-glycerate dehydrogenase [Alphaproteobacteria bacterium]